MTEAIPIIYVTVDSLRRDAIDVYSTDRGETPSLASLADDGVVFETAVTNAPNTDQSFRAALTSLYPNEPTPMAQRSYLPALLSEAGYQTAAVYDTPKLAQKGFNRGFDRHPEQSSNDAGEDSSEGSTGLGEQMVARGKSMIRGTLTAAAHRSERAYELLKTMQFRASPPYDRAAEINEQVMSVLAERSTDDLFLWVHYMDTHYPYLPTEEVRRAHGVELSDWTLANINVEIQKFISSDFNADIDDETLKQLRTLYQCQVGYIDNAIGSLINALCKQGLYEDALVVFASDHGEEFLEHGHLGHSQHLYDELIRVPFVVKPPENASFSPRVDGLVEYLDILPTILDFAGVDRLGEFRGRSLRGPMERGHSGMDAVISEWVHHGERVASIRTETNKYICDGIRNRKELYDLETDPGETDNLIEAHPSEADKLRSKLFERLPDFNSHDIDRDKFDADIARRLEDLGYP